MDAEIPATRTLDAAARALVRGAARDNAREKRGTFTYDHYVDWGLPFADVTADVELRVTYTVKITDLRVEVARISDLEVSAFLDEKDDEDDDQLVARKEKDAERQAEAVIRRDVVKDTTDVIDDIEEQVWSEVT